MGMGVGLQPPRLRRTHPSGELPRSSKGPQSPQDAAWGTCPWPPCPRSCAGPERLPRGHLSSPRHTAAGWGGGSLGPRPSLDWYGQAQEPAWVRQTGPGSAPNPGCPVGRSAQDRTVPSTEPGQLPRGAPRCPPARDQHLPQQHQEGCQPGFSQCRTPCTPPSMVGLAPRGHPPRVTRDATAPWTEGAE